MTIIYSVSNKVFVRLFSTREAAEEFARQHSTGSNGLNISVVQVFGPLLEARAALKGQEK